MLHDYKLAGRMIVKYPGLTIAGGLALAIAIGVGAGWYDLCAKLLWPTIPLPDGHRLVMVEMHDAQTNTPELRVTATSSSGGAQYRRSRTWGRIELTSAI